MGFFLDGDIQYPSTRDSSDMFIHQGMINDNQITVNVPLLISLLNNSDIDGLYLYGTDADNSNAVIKQILNSKTALPKIKTLLVRGLEGTDDFISSPINSETAQFLKTNPQIISLNIEGIGTEKSLDSTKLLYSAIRDMPNLHELSDFHYYHPPGSIDYMFNTISSSKIIKDYKLPTADFSKEEIETLESNLKMNCTLTDIDLLHEDRSVQEVLNRVSISIDNNRQLVKDTAEFLVKKFIDHKDIKPLWEQKYFEHYQVLDQKLLDEYLGNIFKQKAIDKQSQSLVYAQNVKLYISENFLTLINVSKYQKQEIKDVFTHIESFLDKSLWGKYSHTSRPKILISIILTSNKRIFEEFDKDSTHESSNKRKKYDNGSDDEFINTYLNNNQGNSTVNSNPELMGEPSGSDSDVDYMMIDF
jgi:hypothetical protein